ncbi:MAG: hypothetical protein HUN04_15950 [Desulfobacter sp.]|nr:MAG: hypothetical protein HUN04_15950 [Desulfobacter sp.]
MAFVNIPDLPGKIYVPDKKKHSPCKHGCRDCFSCEFCSDDRCRICLKQKEKMPGNKPKP